jgi:hypothetical protein
MAADPITAGLNLGKSILERLFPDPEARAEGERELYRMAQTGELASLATRAGIITAEAQGESWLQRNWRPVTMLSFVGLIGAHWLGFTAPNLSEAQIVGLLDIVKIGLGGYVIGRSAEKTMKHYRSKGDG